MTPRERPDAAAGGLLDLAGTAGGRSDDRKTTDEPPQTTREPA
jgi:hypothetical protein